MKPEEIKDAKHRINVQCHCKGKRGPGIKAVVYLDGKPSSHDLRVWCSPACYDDWATGGM